MRPEVLNRKDFSGKLPPNTILIDRTTDWGNPFHLGKHGTRDQVCDLFEVWIVTQPELMVRLGELRGRHLRRR